MAPVPPLPVPDLIAFGLLLAALVGLHALRVQARSAGSTGGEQATAALGTNSPLELLSHVYQAAAWLCAWYGLAIAARLVGLV